jgi:hypothetical protein
MKIPADAIHGLQLEGADDKPADLCRTMQGDADNQGWPDMGRHLLEDLTVF